MNKTKPRYNNPHAEQMYNINYERIMQCWDYRKQHGHFPEYSDFYKDAEEFGDIQAGMAYFINNRLYVVENIDKYRYLITFTLKDPALSLQARNLIYGLKERKESLGITKLEITEELTKNNVPHWHVIVYSKKCIKKNRFNHYITHFGNIDIRNITPGTEHEVMNYINKESPSVEI